jgi:hypothetical protein
MLQSTSTARFTAPGTWNISCLPLADQRRFFQRPQRRIEIHAKSHGRCPG